MVAMTFSVMLWAVPGVYKKKTWDFQEIWQTEQLVAGAWIDAMISELDDMRVVINVQVVPGRLHYLPVFGCGEKGDEVATVSGCSNPKIFPSEKLGEFCDAITRIAKKTADLLGCSEVEVIFTSVDRLVRIQGEDKGGVQKWGFE